MNTDSHGYERLNKLTLTIVTVYLTKKINSAYECSTYRHIMFVSWGSPVVCATDCWMVRLLQVLTLGHDHKVAVWPAGAPPRGAASLSSRRQPTIAARTKFTSVTIISTTTQKEKKLYYYLTFLYISLLLHQYSSEFSSQNISSILFLISSYTSYFIPCHFFSRVQIFCSICFSCFRLSSPKFVSLYRRSRHEGSNKKRFQPT
jgi:hypothetical protein